MQETTNAIVPIDTKKSSLESGVLPEVLKSHQSDNSNQSDSSQNEGQDAKSVGISKLVFKGTKSGSLKENEVYLRKCRCRNVWCLKCFQQKRAKEIGERLDRLDYRSTRHLILSFDRRPGVGKWQKGPEEGYLAVREEKAIRQMIHNLSRTKGVKVRDWVWVLEWHGDGFPHWHVFLDVTTKGRKGMIGGDDLRKYWRFGNVTEDYIRDKKHWKNITGYFGQKGYFDKGKAHQAILPEWAMNMDRSKVRFIKRSDSKKIKCSIEPREIKQLKEEKRDSKKFKEAMETNANEWNDRTEGMFSNPDREEKELKKYEVILESCGQQTCMEVRNGQADSPIEFYCLPLPYDSAKEILGKGEYIDRVGLRYNLSDGELSRICQLAELIYGDKPNECVQF